MQVLRQRVNRVREWIGSATSNGRGIVPINTATLGCAFAGWVNPLQHHRHILHS
jgi:hypothetical protein